MLTSAFPLLPFTVIPGGKIVRNCEITKLIASFTERLMSKKRLTWMSSYIAGLFPTPGDSNSSMRTPTVGRYSPARELYSHAHFKNNKLYIKQKQKPISPPMFSVASARKFEIIVFPAWLGPTTATFTLYILKMSFSLVGGIFRISRFQGVRIPGRQPYGWGWNFWRKGSCAAAGQVGLHRGFPVLLPGPRSSSQVLLDSLWILDPASKPNNTRAGGNNFSLTSGQQEKICVTKS